MTSTETSTLPVWWRDGITVSLITSTATAINIKDGFTIRVGEVDTRLTHPFHPDVVLTSVSRTSDDAATAIEAVGTPREVVVALPNSNTWDGARQDSKNLRITSACRRAAEELQSIASDDLDGPFVRGKQAKDSAQNLIAYLNVQFP